MTPLARQNPIAGCSYSKQMDTSTSPATGEPRVSLSPTSAAELLEKGGGEQIVWHQQGCTGDWQILQGPENQPHIAQEDICPEAENLDF